MTPLERHIRLVSGFASRQAKQEDLAPLMDMNVAPGQRAFVYRNSGMLACIEALMSNYRRLATLMGEVSFRDMARAFVARYPPERRSLVGYGEALPAFIDAHSGEHGLSWLADLARLDRGWLEAHLSGDPRPIGVEAVTGLSEEDLLAMRFATHPSVRIVDIGFDLAAIWTLLDQDCAPEGQVQISEGRACHLFWRPAHEVLNASLPPATGTFLAALIAGETLGQACESAIAAEPGAELSAIIAFAFQSGLLMAGTARGGRNHDDH